MKDGLICGVVIGMIAGALLYKYNPEAKQIVNDAENVVKKELKSMQKSEQGK
jgi:di/tricarboxylate transporter